MIADFQPQTIKEYVKNQSHTLATYDNGEGMVYSSLDELLDLIADCSVEAFRIIQGWRECVFRGRQEFNAESDELLKSLVNVLTQLASHFLRQAEARSSEYGELENCKRLQSEQSKLSQLLNNWQPPALSVSPGPRVVLPDSFVQSGIKALNAARLAKQ